MSRENSYIQRRSRRRGNSIYIQNANAELELNNAVTLEKETTAGSTASALNQRTQSILSRIRSREPGQVAKFTHPLSDTRTSPDVLVDFDGPDDPYYPRNWGFAKKCVTTVLYGLTTMGKRIFIETAQLFQCPANRACWRVGEFRCYLGKCSVRCSYSIFSTSFYF